MSLSRSAQKIQGILAKNGANFKVMELSASTRTANDAASAIGCEVAQIIKSLVFMVKGVEKPILVLARGTNRVKSGNLWGLLPRSPLRTVRASFPAHGSSLSKTSRLRFPVTTSLVSRPIV
ncbi:MAG: hypothetical protein HYW48_10920, partial [Deltaproteobacteria bacterium]|nr:hypothetical protein [Deltaproteobacteria bacterium]